MGDVTVLLNKANQGEGLAVGQLFELLYPELKRMARAKLRGQDDRLLMDTCMLVHETFMRLVNAQRLSLPDRRHFLGYAAQVMRSVVVDTVRHHQAQRRGGGLSALVTLNTVTLESSVANPEDEILAVHQALEELAQIGDRLVKVVEMRYFVGLSNAEIAEVLGVTTKTVERDWLKARLFLYQQIKGNGP